LANDVEHEDCVEYVQLHVMFQFYTTLLTNQGKHGGWTTIPVKMARGKFTLLCSSGTPFISDWSKAKKKKKTCVGLKANGRKTESIN